MTQDMSHDLNEVKAAAGTRDYTLAFIKDVAEYLNPKISSNRLPLQMIMGFGLFRMLAHLVGPGKGKNEWLKSSLLTCYTGSHARNVEWQGHDPFSMKLDTNNGGWLSVERKINSRRCAKWPLC